MKNPKFELVLGRHYLYTHPELIRSIQIDHGGSILINEKYIKTSSGPLRGYTVIAREDDKLLLFKDVERPVKRIV